MIRIAFLLLLANLWPSLAVALDSDREQPAVVDAQDIEIDISSGLWIYRGNVTVQQGTLYMKADEIRLFFENDELARAVASGDPAIFEQQPEGSNFLLKARAQNIDIDELKNIAVFSGDARLQQNRDVITGETIIYQMKTEKITVRGNASALGQTRRLVASDPEQEEESLKEHAARPKVILQSSSDEVPIQISNPSRLNDKKEAGQNDKSDKAAGSSQSEKNIVGFLAAHVVQSGTKVYRSPDSEAPLLGNLSGGTPVKIRVLRDNWARATIPSGINVWVSDSYVQKDSNNETTVKGRGVRARWLPSTDSQIVGVFKPQEKVRVLGTKENWKQVVLPPSIPAWIPIDQLEIMEDISSVWRENWANYVTSNSEIGN